MQYKVWRAIHVPLTIALFVVLAFHVVGTRSGAPGPFELREGPLRLGPDLRRLPQRRRSRSGPAVVDGHAQDGTITEAQLPVTLAENQKLADAARRRAAGPLRHSRRRPASTATPGRRPVRRKHQRPVPLERGRLQPRTAAAVSGGDDAVNSDGVGCIVCHTQAVAARRARLGPLTSGEASGDDNFGIQYGPLFTDPDPLPVPKHGMNSGTDDWWSSMSARRSCAGRATT